MLRMKPCDVSSQRAVISLRDSFKMSSVFVFAHTFVESLRVLRWLGIPRLKSLLPCGDGLDFVALLRQLDFTAEPVGVGQRAHRAGACCVGTAMPNHSPETSLDRETFLDVPGVSDWTAFQAPRAFESVDFTFASTFDHRLPPAVRPLLIAKAIFLLSTTTLPLSGVSHPDFATVALADPCASWDETLQLASCDLSSTFPSFFVLACFCFFFLLCASFMGLGKKRRTGFAGAFPPQPARTAQHGDPPGVAVYKDKGCIRKWASIDVI